MEATKMSIDRGMDKDVVWWEGGSGWGIHVYPRLIHVNIWQKPLQYCKVISLQLIKKLKKKQIKKNKDFHRLTKKRRCGLYMYVSVCIHTHTHTHNGILFSHKKYANKLYFSIKQHLNLKIKQCYIQQHGWT